MVDQAHSEQRPADAILGNSAGIGKARERRRRLKLSQCVRHLSSMNAIETQILTVIYQQNEQSGEEFFRYTPGLLGGIILPPALKQIDRALLRRQVEDIRHHIELLTEQAK